MEQEDRQVKCDYCDAGWEDRSYEGECESFGCLIYGNGIALENCALSQREITKRLKELKDYEAGKIERPQWVANRFIRELDESCAFSGEPSCMLPSYPPKRMNKGCYFSIYGRIDLHYERRAEYRRGYEDGKNGMEMHEP